MKKMQNYGTSWLLPVVFTVKFYKRKVNLTWTFSAGRDINEYNFPKILSAYCLKSILTESNTFGLCILKNFHDFCIPICSAYKM